MVRSYAGVLLATGATVLGSYLLGLFPQLNPYMPTTLMESAPLLVGANNAEDYLAAVVVTVILTLAGGVVSIPIMNRRSL